LGETCDGQCSIPATFGPHGRRPLKDPWPLADGALPATQLPQENRCVVGSLAEPSSSACSVQLRSSLPPRHLLPDQALSPNHAQLATGTRSSEEARSAYAGGSSARRPTSVNTSGTGSAALPEDCGSRETSRGSCGDCGAPRRDLAERMRSSAANQDRDGQRPRSGASSTSRDVP
jgi:hypothetical protein